MNQVVLDSDAVLILRNRGVLDPILDAILRVTSGPAIIGDYCARSELSGLSVALDAYKSRGWVRFEAVPTRGHPGSEVLRELRQRGADKGEREAIAWATAQGRGHRPIFVSNDIKARQHAAACGLSAHDPFDLIVMMVCEAGLNEQQIREACASWEDKSQQFGRPKDFTTYDRTFSERRAKLRL